MEQLISLIASIITITKTLKPFFDEARQSFSWAEKASRGIVKRSQLSKGKRLTGEVFAAELLTEPVRIEPSRRGGPLRIIIDRRNVEQAVITSAGKRELCESFITPQINEIIKLDRSIHKFLRSYLSRPSEEIEPLVLPPMPFRWGSGGIVSLVNVGGHRHVPMFFRDIPPAGWNIPLGSSERLIDHDGSVLSDFDHELNSPSLFMLREFLEETLVLDRHPSADRPKRFHFRMPYDLGWAQARIAQHLQDEHRQLRRRYDHIEIVEDDDHFLRPSLLALPMDLTIHSDQRDHDLSNVLVSINCLELGIEVVKVIEYDIPGDVKPYFLDGEILAMQPSSPELVRMPIALFPLDLLRELFDGDVKLQYHGAAQASLEIPRALSMDDVTLFTYDIERRNAIINDNAIGINGEAARYQKWKSEFGDFSDGCISSLFTPATVKILNMLFSANIA